MSAKPESLYTTRTADGIQRIDAANRKLKTAAHATMLEYLAHS